MFREVSITTATALAGGRVEVKVPKEGTLLVDCPAGIPDMAKIRKHGRGYYPLGDGPRGDLIVTVRVR